MKKTSILLLVIVLCLPGCATVVDRMNGVPNTTLEPIPENVKKPTAQLDLRFTPGYTLGVNIGKGYLSMIRREVQKSEMFVVVDEKTTADFKLEFHLDANSAVGRGAASAVASGFTLGVVPSQDKVVTTHTASLSKTDTETVSTYTNTDGVTESFGLFFIALSSKAEQGSRGKVLDQTVPNQARALLKEIRDSAEYQAFISE